MRTYSPRWPSDGSRNAATGLLINAVVDPDEAAARLPVGLRPHVTDVGTVVGCCLLDVVRLRPAGLPGRGGHRNAGRGAPDLGRVGRRAPGSTASASTCRPG